MCVCARARVILSPPRIPNQVSSEIIQRSWKRTSLIITRFFEPLSKDSKDEIKSLSRDWKDDITNMNE